MENSELLERFLPGYRLVCRLFARYLGIDLTDFMTKAFVVFALLKSAQYLWNALSGILVLCLTSSVEVSERTAVYGDVMAWLSGNVLQKAGVTGVRALSVKKVGSGEGDGEEKVNKLGNSRRMTSSLQYEPAYDRPVWFFHGLRVIFLRRQKTALHGEMIILTCIGLTTEPLRDFLAECVESSAPPRAIKPHGQS